MMIEDLNNFIKKTKEIDPYKNIDTETRHVLYKKECELMDKEYEMSFDGEKLTAEEFLKALIYLIGTNSKKKLNIRKRKSKGKANVKS